MAGLRCVERVASMVLACRLVDALRLALVFGQPNHQVSPEGLVRLIVRGIRVPTLARNRGMQRPLSLRIIGQTT